MHKKSHGDEGAACCSGAGGVFVHDGECATAVGSSKSGGRAAKRGGGEKDVCANRVPTWMPGTGVHARSGEQLALLNLRVWPPEQCRNCSGGTL